MNFFKEYFFLVVFTVCLFANPVLANYTDDTQTDFDAGTHQNTQWDADNLWLEMTAAGLTANAATHTSRIIDAGSSASWSSLSWVPNMPYLKELPDSGASESGYANGNIDMSGNFLLAHLNESTGTLADSSGNGNNLTNSGAGYSDLGRFNTGMRFLTRDYMYRINGASLNPSDAITISAWFRITSDPSNYSTLVSKFASGYSGWHLSLDNGAGNARFWVTTSGGNNIITFSNNDITLNKWHNLVGVYDGSTIKIYLDGSLKNSTSASGSIVNTSSNFILGRLYAATNDYYFNGYLDEVALWSRGLSATEVLNLYKRGALRLQLQVRSCDDASCSGENFVGQSGSTSNYFEEQDSNTTALPSFNLSGAVSDNRYFQYRIIYLTSSSTLSPELTSLTLGSSGSEGGGGGGDGNNAVPEFTDFMYVSILFFALFFFIKKVFPKYVSPFVFKCKQFSHYIEG